MNYYLRPWLYSVWGLIQEVSCQLFEFVLIEITQSFKELPVKLELRAEVKSFVFVELFLCIGINELSIVVGCYEV
jgi:hypothetical protein